MILRRIAFVLSLSLMPVAMSAQTQVVPESEAQISLSFVPVVKAAAPAVVNIYATVVVEERVSPFAGDPFFEQLFQDFAQVTPRLENSLGSGVIVGSEGIVVSNHHVVQQATEIRVELADRREFKAHVLLEDEESDLAILQLEGASDLPALPLRNSDDLEVGELVLAIGNPFGVGQTVSSGIVSGLARSAMAVGGGRGYFIQTDAAINPGNSGGALVDITGRLVGINTAILSKGGGSNGIGFAIPSNLVQTFVEQALAGETRFQRPWAGVTGQAMDAAMAEALGLARPEGVMLTDLHPESPFRSAGLQVGDVILELAGERTDSPQEVIFRLSSIGIGKQVPLVYRRGRDEIETEITLIAPPDSPPRKPLTLDGATVLRGLSVSNVNPAVIAEMGLPPQAEGVVVTGAVDRAARVGLRPGDVMLGINGAAVLETADVAKLSEQNVRRWRLDILRDGRHMVLNFRV